MSCRSDQSTITDEPAIIGHSVDHDRQECDLCRVTDRDSLARRASLCMRVVEFDIDSGEQALMRIYP